MFQEDYEKLTRGEQRQFEDAVNDLLYTCFIVRKALIEQLTFQKFHRHIYLLKDITI